MNSIGNRKITNSKSSSGSSLCATKRDRKYLLWALFRTNHL